MKLSPIQGDSGWWIADYGQMRGSAPTLIDGPFHTKTDCQDAIRDRLLLEHEQQRRTDAKANAEEHGFSYEETHDIHDMNNFRDAFKGFTPSTQFNFRIVIDERDEIVDL